MFVDQNLGNNSSSFQFTDKNLLWAQKIVSNYPKGRHFSSIVPILWRAQEQNNGWLSEDALMYVSNFLSMPYIRVMEIVTFYSMFFQKHEKIKTEPASKHWFSW